jgi:hypothetical protein
MMLDQSVVEEWGSVEESPAQWKDLVGKAKAHQRMNSVEQLWEMGRHCWLSDEDVPMW